MKRNLEKELGAKTVRSSAKGGALDVNVEAIKEKVYNNIGFAYNERKLNMKSKRKALIIAIAAVFVLGITVIAVNSGIASWNSSSSANPEYKTLPTAEQCIKDIGYEPVIIGGFENGYSFKEGNIIKNDLKDDGGNLIEKFKSVQFDYSKGGDEVIFSQDKFNSEMGAYGSVVSTVGGTDIYYHSYVNKVVPPEYKMTDEDKKAEESGELVFTWGSDKVEIKTVQNVHWDNGENHFQLMQINGKLSADELAEMAKEIIKK